jgi:hypothetical protein
MWGALSDERIGLSFTIAADLASEVILGTESRGTRDHILLSQIRDFTFRLLLQLAGLRWKYSTPPPHEINPPNRSRSRSLLPATSRHAHSWHRAPLGPMAIYLFNVQIFFPPQIDSRYIVSGDPMENTVFSCRVLLCYQATSRSTVHREYSFYCVFAGKCISSRCLAMGIWVKMFLEFTFKLTSPNIKSTRNHQRKKYKVTER